MGKKIKSSTAKPRRRKPQRAAAAIDADALATSKPEAVELTVALPGEVGATKPPRGRRGGRGRRGRGDAAEPAVVATPVESAATNGPVAASAGREARADVQPAAQIEQSGNAVVIRFPPAAPRPAARAAPAASPTVAPLPPIAAPPSVEPVRPGEPLRAPAASRFESAPHPDAPARPAEEPGRGADEPGRGGRGRGGRGRGGRDDRRGPRRDGPRVDPPARGETSRPVQPPTGPTPGESGGLSESEQRLSPSQKRRLRRKRRQQMMREHGEGASGARGGARPDEPRGDADPLGPSRTLHGDEVEASDDLADLLDDDRVESVKLADDARGTGAVEIDTVGDFAAPAVIEDEELEELVEAREAIDPLEPDEAPPTVERAGRGRGGRGRGRERDRAQRGRHGRRRWRDDDNEAAPTPAVAYDSVELDEPSTTPESLQDVIEEIAATGGEEEEAAPPTTGTREMIINVVQREESRIAILHEGKLEEIYLERASAENHVGNIYKGIITNVEPSIQAAFVDFGLGKNGFLHISDLHPRYFPNGGSATENVGRKLPRRQRPPIQRCLRRGQELFVQINKEGIGTKGPTLTTYLSIPGRFLVMMPGMARLGVSRKIEDDDLRRTLREQLDHLELPDDMGFIARTAAMGRTKRELQSDLHYLTRLWRAVEKRMQEHAAPCELYRESDLVIRTIRDVYSHDIRRIIVDDAEIAERARQFLSIFSPRSRDLVVEYQAPEPIFHKYGIESELEKLHSRVVPLSSGGSLVIDQTEALVAIDVNSGKFRTEDDAETTAFKINLEAADEIARQLRLRDLGGVIICDFIDLREDRHRREVERRLIKNLKQHKERAKLLRMSAFGIIEMTRQRQRASLTRSVYQTCQHCRGTGIVKTTESVVLDVMRQLQFAMTREHIRNVEVVVSSEVANLLQNRKRAVLHEFETRNRRNIHIKPDPIFGLDQVQMNCYDTRGRLVPAG